MGLRFSRLVRATETQEPEPEIEEAASSTSEEPSVQGEPEEIPQEDHQPIPDGCDRPTFLIASDLVNQNPRDLRYYAVWEAPRGAADRYAIAGVHVGVHPRPWRAILDRLPNRTYTPGTARLRQARVNSATAMSSRKSCVIQSVRLRLVKVSSAQINPAQVGPHQLRSA